VTLKRWPPIVRVPARAGPVVAATSNLTVALPVPLAPDLIWIHSLSDDAFQVQSALDACTSTLPVPPVSGKLPDDVLRRMVHSAAACEMAGCWSFTAIVPRRVMGSVLAATTYSTDPSPWPLDEPLMVSQPASLAADHAHSRSVLIVS
jgi:hypothetical protein